MYRERNYFGLRIVLYLALINALATVVHFILLNQGILPQVHFNGNIWDYALPIGLAGVLPLLAGVIGLFRRRMWGLGFLTLGNGAYFFASLSLLRLTYAPGEMGIMFYIALYLLVYSLISHFYTWGIRYSFKDY